MSTLITPNLRGAKEDKTSEPPQSEPPERLDKEHGDEVGLPEHPEGNVEIMVERGRQMGF